MSKSIKHIAFFKLNTVMIIVSTYIGAFYVTSHRYEQSLTRLENRIVNLTTQMESENWCEAILRIPKLQLTKIPVEPYIWSPISIIKSFFKTWDDINPEIQSELQELIRIKKKELSNLTLHNFMFTPYEVMSSDFDKNFQTNKYMGDFTRSNLSNSELNNSFISGLDFSNSDFTNTSLLNIQAIMSNFSKSIFITSIIIDADFRYSLFRNVNFGYNIISSANFQKAKLINASFKKSTIQKSDFRDAWLIGSDFSEAIYIKQNNFENAIYNSQPIGSTELEILSKFGPKFHDVFCKNKYNNLLEKYNKCLKKIYPLYTYPLYQAPSTKFLQRFDPSAYEMFDISEFIQFIKDSITN